MDTLDVKIYLTIFLSVAILTTFWTNGIYLLIGMLTSTLVNVWRKYE